MATQYQRERRANRPDVRQKGKEWSLKRNRELREYVWGLKDKPCTDCGVKYPPYVMQFDHLDKELKLRNISKFYSKQAIDQEVKKCDVVCANCHAIRTYTRNHS